ncbi:MAG: 3-hydroxyacyl-ACP dehydratase FabZ family protein [Pirellulales bacterium]
MRWFWIDRFTEFVRGEHAVAVKCVSLSEDFLHDHFPGVGVFPHSLVVEGMAQTGGLLAGQYYDFKERVVLAKVSKAQFYCSAEPGQTLVYRAVLDQIDPTGAITTCTAHVQDRLQCEAQIFFAHIDRDTAHRPLFTPHEFATTVRSLRIFEVGRTPEGEPLTTPDHFVEAERAAMAAVGA